MVLPVAYCLKKKVTVILKYHNNHSVSGCPENDFFQIVCISCISLLVTVPVKRQILRLKVKAGDNVTDQVTADAVVEEVSHIYHHTHNL